MSYPTYPFLSPPLGPEVPVPPRTYEFSLFTPIRVSGVSEGKFHKDGMNKSIWDFDIYTQLDPVSPSSV